jgi:potassium-transporting ATPase KdpC subunit
MKTIFLPALRLIIVLTVLTGVLYPITMTILAQWMFPFQANGSMIKRNGVIIGSELIGQKFITDKYFGPRPSAVDYNPLPSSGSNFSPTSQAMVDSMNARNMQFVKQNHLPKSTIVPKDMLFASASGLDPHISPEAAFLQTARVIRARGLDSTITLQVNNLIQRNIESPQWNIFGQERINVLKLNLAIDNEFPNINSINKR